MLVNAWVVEGPKAEEVAEVALVAVVVVVVVVAAAECEFVKRPCRRRIGRRWDLCACRRSRSRSAGQISTSRSCGSGHVQDLRRLDQHLARDPAVAREKHRSMRVPVLYLMLV